jgi:hypothetical protein
VPLDPGCPGPRPASPEVTRAICRVPSTPFAQTPGYAQPVHLCRFRVRSVVRGLFPGDPRPPAQSDQGRPRPGPVTTRGPRNVDLVPIGYACRPRLRGRLTLRGLTWRRNPWTSGGSVSHAPVATHVSIRTPRASSRARARPSPAWGTLRYRSAARAIARPGGRARGFGAWLEPRYIFGAGQLNRPVSCYAFFKGWLLLSQPPGCPGRPTSFPT